MAFNISHFISMIKHHFSWSNTYVHTYTYIFGLLIGLSYRQEKYYESHVTEKKMMTYIHSNIVPKHNSRLIALNDPGFLSLTNLSCLSVFNYFKKNLSPSKLFFCVFSLLFCVWQFIIVWKLFKCILDQLSIK